jgi:hypothetical protein
MNKHVFEAYITFIQYYFIEDKDKNLFNDILNLHNYLISANELIDCKPISNDLIVVTFF